MEKKVINILAEFTEVGVDKIALTSSLIADLGLSSLDIINVVVTFEEEFGVEILDESIRELVTVGDIVKYLEKCDF